MFVFIYLDINKRNIKIMKIKIEINNATSKISGLPRNVKSVINSHLAVKMPNYWFSPKYKQGLWDGTIKFFQYQTGMFPTGLLPRILELLEEVELTDYEIVDLRKDLKTFKVDPINYGYKIGEKTVRNYQVDAVNSVLTNSVNGRFYPRGIINIATNGGKTLIASVILKQVYPKLVEQNKVFLFVTHSKEIAQQSKKSIEEILGEEVGFIGDGKWNVKPVTIAIITTLYSRKTKPEFLELTKDIVGYIGDECHHSKSTSWYEVFQLLENAVYRVGLTGTVDDSNELNKTRLVCATGSVLTKVSNEFLIEQGFSARPICVFFQVEKPEDLDELSYQDVYREGIVVNPHRAKLINLICTKETSRNNKVLILVERVEHGLLLLENLNLPGKVVEFTHGGLDSAYRQEILEDLANGDIDVLISTSILDEGVDVSNINAVVYARGMKSDRKLLQGIGRGLRKKEDGSALRFYEFIDNTHDILLNHSLQRYKTLRQENFEIKLFTPENYLITDLEEL